ncbi:hypothetical protein PR048_017181 [Dryococelus australis]|uniref:Ig-like domain-containing protein n=1 Tax=Dryococelus australis TaxID=614101 RepID=A0ABQ9H8T3_9NEOP|nr:hypothetical protein PR048_017181 [Dryococelus australis]
MLQVVWHRDSMPLEATAHRLVERRDDKHALTILNVQALDFGNYSCVAENKLGRATKYMELSGRCTTPQVVTYCMYLFTQAAIRAII